MRWLSEIASPRQERGEKEERPLPLGKHGDIDCQLVGELSHVHGRENGPVFLDVAKCGSADANRATSGKEPLAEQPGEVGEAQKRKQIDKDKDKIKAGVENHQFDVAGDALRIAWIVRLDRLLEGGRV